MIKYVISKISTSPLRNFSYGYKIIYFKQITKILRYPRLYDLYLGQANNRSISPSKFTNSLPLNVKYQEETILVTIPFTACNTLSFQF